MEDIASYAFTDGHAQVHIQPYPGNAHAGIVLIRRRQVRGVMVVVVAAVGMSCMLSGLHFGRRHGGNG